MILVAGTSVRCRQVVLIPSGAESRFALINSYLAVFSWFRLTFLMGLVPQAEKAREGDCVFVINLGIDDRRIAIVTTTTPGCVLFVPVVAVR